VWDVASARSVAGVPGCRAIATASASIAAAHGYADGENIPVDLMLAAVGRIVAGVELPVTADLEAGYGDVDRTVRRAIQLGVVGANIEDAMRPLNESVALMRTAIAAGEAEGVPLVLNARTDVYLAGGGPPDDLFAETVRRGRAFLDVGADCVFVAGCTDAEVIAALAATFGPGRLSVIGSPPAPSPRELERLGVARVSFGPYPSRVVLGALEELAADVLR
jgi:2-methylisocitrate lyase-like PEP mutase family enzyme